jgi:type III pantothenate kinase
MILVDIGNSGLRALSIETAAQFEVKNVFRLSWPADLTTHKALPQQSSIENHRWCRLDQTDAFAWLVESVAHANEQTWWISSVKQSALDRLRDAIHHVSPRAHLKTIAHRDISMELDVEYPERVGIDRALAAWEAWSLSKQTGPIVVVQAGTAVTVDLVECDESHRKVIFRGGAIMPGLGLSLQLLAAGTDQLPWIAQNLLVHQPDLPGKNTDQAIAAGVHASLAGGVKFLIDRYREREPQRSTPVILSGGDAHVLAPFIPQPSQVIEHLVLRALNRLACGDNRPNQR